MEIRKPVRDATLELSPESATVWHFVPNFACTIEEVRSYDVTSVSSAQKDTMISTFSERTKILLGADDDLPFLGGRKFSSVLPNEFVVSSYINPRYYNVMRDCYGYSERNVALELGRIYRKTKVRLRMKTILKTTLS